MSKGKVQIFHNPRCTKSRETLNILNAKKIKTDIVEYLKSPPNAKELKEIIQKLDIKPKDLIRKGEAIYKEKYSKKEYSDKEWIDIMVKNPILIERPIVVKDNQAVIGRPPEKVLKLIK